MSYEFGSIRNSEGTKFANISHQKYLRKLPKKNLESKELR